MQTLTGRVEMKTMGYTGARPLPLWTCACGIQTWGVPTGSGWWFRSHFHTGYL